MNARIVFLSIALCVGGCVRQVLNHEIKLTMQGIGDLQYDQIMFNLAATAENPSAVPSQATFTTGEVSVSNAVNPTLKLTIVDGGNLGNRELGAGDTASLAAKWTITPIAGAKLRTIQLWYRYAIESERAVAGEGPSSQPSKDPMKLLGRLQQFRNEDAMQQNDSALPTVRDGPTSRPVPETAKIASEDLPAKGWLRIGGAVPKGTRFIGKCRGSVVWVPKDREEDFAKFAMLVLEERSLTSAIVVSGNSATVTH